MTPTSVITALEKALEAGPTFELWKAQISQQGRACGIVSESGEGIVNWNGLAKPKGVGHANAALIAACSPLAIRTLLDAHASALRDAAKLRELLGRFVEQDKQIGCTENNLYRSALAALDDNTKGEPS